MLPDVLKKALMVAVSQRSFPVGTLRVLAVLPHNLHEWLALLGRTHVIMIHFPIALLLMAALGEVGGRIRGRSVGWTTGTLMCGALGAVFSMGLGWMLVWFSRYETSTTLTLHQYLGTATAFLAILSSGVYWKFGRKRPQWWTTVPIVLTAAMVGLTGHLGGTLVHGSLFSQ